MPTPPLTTILPLLGDRTRCTFKRRGGFLYHSAGRRSILCKYTWHDRSPTSQIAEPFGSLYPAPVLYAARVFMNIPGRRG